MAVERIRNIVGDHLVLTELDMMSSRKQSARSDTFNELEHPFPCYELPPRRDRFVGRNQQAIETSDYFNSVPYTTSMACFCVHGIGGVGKSAFALNYAWKCQQDGSYDAIFWINNENPLTTKQSFTSISLLLGLATTEDNHDSNIMIVKRWLAKTCTLLR